MPAPLTLARPRQSRTSLCLRFVFRRLSRFSLTCLSSSPPKYQRTLTSAAGLPSLTSQKRVTLRRSVSDTGAAGSIRSATLGLSAKEEKFLHSSEAVVAAAAPLFENRYGKCDEAFALIRFNFISFFVHRRHQTLLLRVESGEG